MTTFENLWNRLSLNIQKKQTAQTSSNKYSSKTFYCYKFDNIFSYNAYKV